MSKPTDVAHSEVDEILSKRRKSRGGRACYPCSKRKVRCDSTEHGIPCTTCTRRGHPDICSYKPNTSTDRRIYSSSRSQRFGRSSEDRYLTHTELQGPERHTYSQVQPRNSSAGTWVSPAPRLTCESESSNSRRTTPNQATKSYENASFRGEDSYLGENSAATLVRGQFEQPDSDRVVRNIRPVLGLQNTSAAYPYMTARSPEQTLKEVYEVLPQSEDILRSEGLHVLAYPTEILDTFISIEPSLSTSTLL